MFSDLPASEVLASHVAASGRAKGEESLPASSEAALSEITYPSHQAHMVSLYQDVHVNPSPPPISFPPSFHPSLPHPSFLSPSPSSSLHPSFPLSSSPPLPPPSLSPPLPPPFLLSPFPPLPLPPSLPQGTTVYTKLPVSMGSLYVYKPPSIHTLGPEVPELEDIESLG